MSKNTKKVSNVVPRNVGRVVHICDACGGSYTYTRYMSLSYKTGSLESSSIALAIKFKHVPGEDAQICPDCYDKIFMELIDEVNRYNYYKKEDDGDSAKSE